MSGEQPGAGQDVQGAAPDPSLDFFSDQFDAAKVLATPGLQPPVPDAQPMDYLAKCRTILPEEMPESVGANVRGVGAKTGSEVGGAASNHR